MDNIWSQALTRAIFTYIISGEHNKGITEPSKLKHEEKISYMISKVNSVKLTNLMVLLW